MALAGAILKKKVPVVVLADSSKANFYLRCVSAATHEGSGERVAKVLAFGFFAGSGKHFDASVVITNRDGVVVFAQNSKKGNFQSAAEEVANHLKVSVQAIAAP